MFKKYSITFVTAFALMLGVAGVWGFAADSPELPTPSHIITCIPLSTGGSGGGCNIIFTS